MRHDNRRWIRPRTRLVGEHVAELQEVLIARGHEPAPTSTFDEPTQQALTALAESNGQSGALYVQT